MRLLPKALKGVARHLGQAGPSAPTGSLHTVTDLPSSFPQNCRVGDGAVRHLGRLPHLRSLNLAHCGVTDAGIQRLAANSVSFTA
jgi:Leucine Rich repeat